MPDYHGLRPQSIPSPKSPRRSDDNRHRLDDGDAICRSCWGMITNAKRLDTSAAPTKSGSIGGRHRSGRLLVLQALHHDIWPSTAQHVLDLTPIDPLVRDHHQCRVITTGHASEADIAPSHPVAEPSGLGHHATAPQSPDAIAQACRRIDPHDGKAPHGCFCRPLAHAMPP